jgi:DnaJ-class molecular chaperone
MDKTTPPTTIQIEKVKVRPTHIAQVCPVCNGFGTLKYGSKGCHACSGKGYILIPAEEIKT